MPDYRMVFTISITIGKFHWIAFSPIANRRFKQINSAHWFLLWSASKITKQTNRKRACEDKDYCDVQSGREKGYKSEEKE